MSPDLLRKLRKWRNETARKEGVELFRVLPNKTIEDIATLNPRSREDLTSIKGIKDKKYYKYGKEILDIVKNSSKENKLSTFESLVSEFKNDKFKDEFKIEDRSEKNEPKENIYSVSRFLDYLNEKLTSEEVKIKGEITSVDEREKVIYFSLKDGDDESIINCLIFRYQYDISGIKIEPGNEIIVSGYPEIYKPYGKLSFKTSLIEIAGEGALKKAYDKLKSKLEKEGLFASERKKDLPELPETIGLITSSQGAAIGDFTTNLGSYGFKIKFVNSSVEGKQAVFDLIKAVRKFKKTKKVDVLVIVRGGGSLESLQAFNNEALIKEIANLKIPVVCGVGHEKDVSLVSLVCDLAVSTPTAAARTIRESWDKAFEKLDQNETILINSFERYLYESNHNIERASLDLNQKFKNILQRFTDTENNFLKKVENISYTISNARNNINNLANRIFSDYSKKITESKNKISFLENTISINDPRRQLKLGYSIVSLKGKIIRSVRELKKGDVVSVKVSDGEIDAEVKENVRD
ncbi:MAG: exodeoxyribonuclease VII large subunit [Candidatus Pacebacteria bacterium]|nr:exodeoxyribonuclease VII large subunit [Candidatus Paceibacterota bacterium]